MTLFYSVSTYPFHHPYVINIHNEISLDNVKCSVDNNREQRDSDMVSTLNKEHWKSEERSVNNDLYIFKSAKNETFLFKTY